MSTIVHSRRGQPVALPVRGTEGPEPGVFENIGANFRIERDEQELVQQGRNARAYLDLMESLGELGIDTARNGKLWKEEYQNISKAQGYMRVPDHDAIYAEALRQRQLDPKRFSNLPASRAEYDVMVARRNGGRDDDLWTAQRGGAVSGFVGGTGGAMTDAVNIALLPLGGGQATVAKTFLVEGLIGALSEVGMLSSRAKARERMGEDYTTKEMITDVAISGVASGVLGGGIHAGVKAAPALKNAVVRQVDESREALEKLIVDKWDDLPEAVRTRWAKGATIADADLPDFTEAILGRSNMTKEQRAMVDAVRRETEIEAVNPFKPDMAGTTAHRTKLDAALADLLIPANRAPRPFELPPRAATEGRLADGTIYSGSSGNSARAALKSKIRGVESSGDDAARNPLSSATGRYQFVSGTWLRYYKRRFGDQGLSDAAILAKRSDGRLQDMLMDDLTADNAAFLRSIGEAESAGNLYLAHFAGTGGAKKIFAADPNARAADVLGKDVVRANPWMADYTARDLIGWAHRKMQEAPPRRAGSRAELADDSQYSGQLQAELDRLQAEDDAATRANSASDGLDEAIDSVTSPLDDGAEPPDFSRIDDGVDDIAPSPLKIDRASDGLSDREMALLPSVRTEIAGKAKLSDLQAMAKRLDATEDEVRRVMEKIAATEKAVLVRSKDGRFRRAPTDRAPVDAFKFIARHGGMADNEGHDLGNIFSVQARGWGKGQKGKGRRQAILIPGAGPLVREGGRSIDEIGELLHDGGYLRLDGDRRPTTTETIAYLEDGLRGKDGRKNLLPMDRMGEQDVWTPPENFEDLRANLHEWANYNAPELDGDDVDQLTRLMINDRELSEDAALTILTNRAVADALDDARFESGEYDEAFAQYLDARGADESGARFDADTRDTPEGTARAAVDGGAGEADAIDLTGWDAADPAIAASITDSVIHDLDADLAIFEGLEGRFFYLDEDGEARAWDDIKAELEQDATELANVRACL